MAKFTNEFIEKIKNQDILEIAANHFDIKRNGSSYVASCSHGSDTTPSLVFYPENNSFFCFGCRAGSKEVTGGSDIISFTRWVGDMSFSESILHLSDIYNIQPEYEEVNKVSRNEEEYESLLNESREYWKHLQTNRAALSYLEQRGIGSEEIAKWRIGLVPRDSNHRHSGKIVFSLMDQYGRIVGFSYRNMSGVLYPEKDDSPKYMNSANSEIFNKSQILYGYHTALPVAKKKGFIIIGEGFGDAILAQKLGLPFISLMGTSLSNYQLTMILSNFKNIILWMDGDSPGIEAMFNHAEKLREGGIVVRGISFAGLDPEDKLIEADRMYSDIRDKEKAGMDFVRNDSRLVSYMVVQDILSLYDSRLNELKLHSMDEVNKIMSKISDGNEKAFLLSMISERFDVKSEDINTKEK